MSSLLSRSSPFRIRSQKSISQHARDEVMKLIDREALRVGDKLPSEAELAQMFNISRPMLREALTLLEQDGLISTTHGRGRFVSAAATLQVERPITAYESITGMLRQLGYRPRTRVISVVEQRAGKQAAEALRCRPGTPVIVLERLRLQGIDPLVYCVEIVRRDSLSGELSPAAFRGSLNELLEREGKRPSMSSASVSAVVLPKPTARLIGTKHPGPWLLITETCFTDRGEPVLFARDYHRGDAFSFNFSRR